MSNDWRYALRFDGQTTEVTGDEVILGRSRHCDVSINDPSVSRRHTVLRPRSGCLVAQDLGSSNGTFLNGEPVRREAVVRDGDVLALGDAELKVSIQQPLPEQAPSAPTPPGPGEATVLLQKQSVELARKISGEGDDLPGREETTSPAIETLPPPEAPVAPVDPVPAPAVAASPPVARTPEPEAALAAPPVAAPPVVAPPVVAPPSLDPTPFELESTSTPSSAPSPPAGPSPPAVPPSESTEGGAVDEGVAPQAPPAPAELALGLETQMFTLEPADDTTKDGAPAAGMATQRLQIPPEDPPTPGMQTQRLDLAEAGVSPTPGMQTQRLDLSEVVPPTPGMQTQRLDLSEVAPPTPGMQTQRLDLGQHGELPQGMQTQELDLPAAPAGPLVGEASIEDVLPPQLGLQTQQLSIGPDGSIQLPGSDASDTPLQASEAPAPEAPAPEAPASEVPASEVPAPEAPASEVPASEVPASEAPASEAPASEVPASDVAEDASLVTPLRPPDVPELELDLPAPPMPPVVPLPEPDAPDPAPSPPAADADRAPISLVDASPDAALGAPAPPASFVEVPTPIVSPEPPAPAAASFVEVPTPIVPAASAPPPPDESPSLAPPSAVSPLDEPSAVEPPPPAESPVPDAPADQEPVQDLREVVESLQTSPPEEPPTPNDTFAPLAPRSDAELLGSLDGFDNTLAGPRAPTVADVAAAGSAVAAGAGAVATEATETVRTGQVARPPAAAFGARLIAAILDLVWVGALAVAGWYVLGPLLPDGVLPGTQLGAAFGAVVGSAVIWLGWSLWGTTPGKRPFRLYVCTLNGRAGIGPGRALVRGLGALLSIATLGLGFLWAAVGERRALHDRIAASYVARLP